MPTRRSSAGRKPRTSARTTGRRGEKAARYTRMSDAKKKRQGARAKSATRKSTGSRRKRIMSQASVSAEPSGQVTTDHDIIRQWIEERGGQPATVKRSKTGNEPGILRVDFPGYTGEGSLEPVSWEEFFDAFEKNNLAFLYQDRTADGQLSRFSKFIRREEEELRETEASE